jgi:hypothetical protein
MREFRRFASDFGEISNVFPRFERGMAFVSYYDIRDAERAVTEGHGQHLNHRMVKTSFAFRPPAHSGRNPRETCSTVYIKSKIENPPVTTDQVRSAIERLGEVRGFETIGPGEFIVRFFNLRAARRVVEPGVIEIRNEEFAVDLRPEEEGGEDPQNHDANQRDRPQPSAPDPAMPTYPYPYPYPIYGMPFPPGYPPLPAQYAQPSPPAEQKDPPE